MNGTGMIKLPNCGPRDMLNEPLQHTYWNSRTTQAKT